MLVDLIPLFPEPAESVANGLQMRPSTFNRSRDAGHRTEQPRPPVHKEFLEQFPIDSSHKL